MASIEIKLEKILNTAPLYGEYANSLAKLIEEIYKTDQNYQILTIPVVKRVYEKSNEANRIALMNYAKYGEPDRDLLIINSICKTFLDSKLNDPDYEVLKEKYYLKQTENGYKYKMTIRGKNRFNGSVIKEITFYLKYSPEDTRYYVVSIKE